MVNVMITIKATSFKSQRLRNKETTRVIENSQIPVSLSNILTWYLVQLNVLEKWQHSRCFKGNFSENVQASLRHRCMLWNFCIDQSSYSKDQPRIVASLLYLFSSYVKWLSINYCMVLRSIWLIKSEFLVFYRSVSVEIS